MVKTSPDKLIIESSNLSKLNCIIYEKFDMLITETVKPKNTALTLFYIWVDVLFHFIMVLFLLGDCEYILRVNLQPSKLLISVQIWLFTSKHAR